MCESETSSRVPDWKRGPDVGAPLAGVAVSDDGTMVATSDEGGTVHVYTLADASEVAALRGTPAACSVPRSFPMGDW